VISKFRAKTVVAGHFSPKEQCTPKSATGSMSRFPRQVQLEWGELRLPPHGLLAAPSESRFSRLAFGPAGEREFLPINPSALIASLTGG